MSKQHNLPHGYGAAVVIAILGAILSLSPFAEAAVGSLKDAKIPPVKDRITDESLIPHFVTDKAKAIELGKALFWDMAAGSDGQACASCHFHAGGDVRLKNTINQGLNGVFDEGGAGAPNYTVTAGDFPITSDDIVSSQGVFPSTFNNVIAAMATDDCNIVPSDPLGFHVAGTNVRRVEPRNAPTMINAAFQLRTFWDGRANNIFNGVDVFGRRNDNARIHEASSPSGPWTSRKIELENSHLASQAVGPPGSNFEMSCAGRAFKFIGRKLLTLTPLGLQNVAADDSVLGSLALPGTGLNTSYADMIMAAFPNKFWDSTVTDVDGFSLMESNFAFFWGISIQLYQQTLIADDSPFDNGNLTASESNGLSVFNNEGKCVNCHDTAMFTKASSQHLIDERQEEGLVERMLMGRENQPYNIVGGGVLQEGRGRPLAQTSFSAGGSPSALGPGGSDAASGDIQVTFMKGKTEPCHYSVDSFVLDPDGNSATRDARATGSGTCGTVTVTVVDDTNYVEVIGSNGKEVSGTVTGDLVILQPAIYDNGFYNIGVRPTSEDIGVGGVDPFGNPLSFSRQYIDLLLGNNVPDPFQIDECTFEVRFNPTIDVFFFPGGFDEVPCDDGSTTHKPSNNAANQDAIRNMRVAVDGALKVPTVRLTELNGPFFHNGGQATLEQLVAFYNRGGDFDNNPNMDPDIRPLGLTVDQQADLVAFLKSLTDERVKCKKAPFDHPELIIPNGHPGDHVAVVDSNGDGQADDDLLTIPAVGAGGVAMCLGPFAP